MELHDWDDWEDLIDEPEKTQVVLTMEQNVIAEHHEGPLIVLAGAGSGKTATLVERAGRMIERGIDPRSMLVLTFSRKAATELKNRLANRFGEPGEDVLVDTFHGFGYQFMQIHKHLFGLGEDDYWAIFSDNDQKRLLSERGKALCDEHNIEFRKFRRFLMDRFSYWSLMKQDGRFPTTFDEAVQNLAEMHQRKTGEVTQRASFWDQAAAQALLEYEDEKRQGGYLDFDDLLLLPAQALAQNPNVSKSLAYDLKHIMVDESQDTNLIQYAIVRQIGRHHRNVVMVGDDDQSIYGWRGARVANLRRFMKDFSAPVQRLEQNFRSHSAIVDGARNLINHNQSRLAKNPFSNTTGGTPPALELANTDRAMAQSIVGQVKGLQSQGVPLRDMAILYRTNRMTQILEPAFKQAGIAYSVVGGMSFYERAEIQAALACVRINRKPDDWHAIKILQPYIDGVGKKGLTDLIEALKPNFIDLHLLAQSEGDTARHYGRSGLPVKSLLVELLSKSGMNNESEYAGQDVRSLVEWMKHGPMKILEREKDEALREKREKNLEQLCHEIENSGRPDWMDYLLEAPISDYVTQTEESDYLTLSTVHRSKGLEWPHVMIAGFSEGLMPFEPEVFRSGAQQTSAAGEDEEDGGRPEEERRLCYVAMTRAESTVTFFHANEYSFPGSEKVRTELSFYAAEIGLTARPEQIHLLDTEPDYGEPENGVDAIFRSVGVA